jgi:hypothetical protein
MTQKDVRLVIKNSGVVNRPLPQSLLPGEAVVNTAEGIVFYSGITTSTNEWTPAGTGTTANFFEVGSNLYDLRLRNRIVAYEGKTGVGLTGKFLSGTTNGFVLADISNIQGVDSYVTGATWNPNQLTLNLNENKPSVSVNISAFSALTITNDLFVLGESTINDLTITGTGIYDGVANGFNINEIVNWSSLTAHTSTTDRYVTGGTYDNNTALITFSGANNFPIFTVDLSSIDVNDTYVTGGTVSYDSVDLNATVTLKRNNNVDIIITGLTDVKTIGATLVGNTVYFDTNESLSAYTLDLSALDVNDIYSTGGTVTQFASNNGNEQIIQIIGNDGFTPYNITGLTDTFVTGFTFTPNTLTISQNNGADLTADIGTVDLSNVLNNVSFNINTTGNITATSFSGTSFSGGTFYGDGSNLTGLYDFYVTGGTVLYDSNELNASLTLYRNDNISVVVTGFTDVQTTGATLIGNTVFFDTNESLSAYTLDLSALQDNNTFVTGFTYNQLNNTITLSQNDNQPNKIINISSFSGISVNNLTNGRVVYVGAGGKLTDESGFEYNQSTNLLTVGNIFVNNPSGTTSNIGQGGLVVGSGGSFSTPGIGDLIVHGNFTVFGNTTTISTTDLNIEDSQITLNYNPTGNTSVSSIGSGILIQDGGGVAGQDVKIGIGQLFGSNISGDTSEYTSTTGFENRAFVTQLNDIVIRNSSPVNFGNPDGVRVLAEGDVLDAGFY